MNNLQIFDNPDFGQIRAVEINGDPWFCLADICQPLGLRAAKCKTRLKKDGVLLRDLTDSIGRPTKMLFVNEGNLYRVIFQSEKPEAEKFIDWVTEDVLPSLRRTGTYSLPSAKPRDLPSGMSYSGLAKLISVTRRVMLDMGSTPIEIGAMTKSLYDNSGIPVPVAFTQQIPGQLCMYDLPALGGAAS